MFVHQLIGSDFHHSGNELNYCSFSICSLSVCKLLGQNKTHPHTINFYAFLLLLLLQVHSANSDKNADTYNYEPFQQKQRNNRLNTSTNVIANTHSRQPHPLRSTIFIHGNSLLRSSSLSPNCLATSSTTSLNGNHLTGNPFLNNLIRMNQTKIWEDAKCRTFYARDNVCNFIKWSKEFGVNQSVLFESDDLVLHGKQQN